MHKKAFNRFFWGFFFAMFNFRIQGFDIVPDVIGYILLYQGLSILVDEGEEFKKGKKTALPMILLSTYTIYDFQPFGEGSAIEFGPPAIAAVIIGILIIAIDLKLVGHIFKGIKNLALERELSQIALEAENNWKNYKALIIATILAYVLIIFPPVAIFMLLGIIIGSIVIMVMIMRFMKKIEGELED